MNPLEESLFKKGYCKLQHGSYYVWISKRWHEMFVRRGLVRKNFYGQFVGNRDTIQELIRWLDLYTKVEHDRDFPKSPPQLKEEERVEIRQTVT